METFEWFHETPASEIAGYSILPQKVNKNWKINFIKCDRKFWTIFRNYPGSPQVLSQIMDLTKGWNKRSFKWNIFFSNNYVTSGIARPKCRGILKKKFFFKYRDGGLLLKTKCCSIIFYDTTSTPKISTLLYVT